MKCFYHNDLDGHCSGAIVQHFEPDCQMIEIQYGQEFPWGLVGNVEEVYMVDFSLEPIEDMQRLSKACDLVWIDHHKAAIEEAKRIGFGCKGRLGGDDEAGCELTWDYFSTDPIPRAVHLLGRYDVWDLDADEEVLPFQYGMRSRETRPEKNSVLWCILFSRDYVALCHGIVREGRCVLNYSEQENLKTLRLTAFDTEFEGLQVLAANKQSNKNFDYLFDSEKYDIMITFYCAKEGHWSVSMICPKERTDLDLGEIAKRRGGGGHKNAAGFGCFYLPFQIPESRLFDVKEKGSLSDPMAGKLFPTG